MKCMLCIHDGQLQWSQLNPSAGLYGLDWYVTHALLYWFVTSHELLATGYLMRGHREGS